MKKLMTLLIFIILTAFSFAEETLSTTTEVKEKQKIKATTRIAFLVDMDGSFNDENNGSLNKAFGGQILLERGYRLNEQIELGMGIGTQGNGVIKTENGTLSGFYSVPVYAEAKYNVIGGALYVKGRLGLPVILADNELKCYIEDSVKTLDKSSLELDGKFFGGLAVGLDYGDFEWECGYSYNSLNYKYKQDGVNTSKNLENIRVSIGFSKNL